MNNNFKQIYKLIVILVLVLTAMVVFAVLLSNGVLVIQLQGESELSLEYGQAYEDPGAKAVLLGFIPVDAPVSVSIEGLGTDLGTYSVTYSAAYGSYQATAQRQVRVVDTQAPVITLKYVNGSIVLPDEDYVEEGFLAEDNYDGDITDKVQREVLYDRVIYTVTDTSGNITVVERKINREDTVPPVLTLLGDATVTIQAGEKFTDPGYTAVDNGDGDITDKVVVSNDHNIYKAGTYTITYSVTDRFGNTATAVRTLVVKAVTPGTTVTPKGGTIYLTFDDGPSKFTLELLEILRKYNVKATFFVVGTMSVQYLDEIHADGHAIGIHCYNHDFKEVYKNVNAYFDDLNRMSDLIFEKIGVRTKLMRFPGGSTSASAEKVCPGIQDELRQMVRDQGYQYFDWNVDSRDAAGAKDADEIYQNVINGCSSRSVSIVLQHDIHKKSVDAVERIIQWGLANGYTFAALDETSPPAHHK